jgi:hypothetical protein
MALPNIPSGCGMAFKNNKTGQLLINNNKGNVKIFEIIYLL